MPQVSQWWLSASPHFILRGGSIGHWKEHWTEARGSGLCLGCTVTRGQFVTLDDTQLPVLVVKGMI